MMRRTVALAVVAVVVVVAGCGGATTPTSGSGPGDASLPPVEHEVSVTTVVDGDTVRVAYPNGTTDTVRLVGVDTPEVHVDNDPAEFDGVPDTDAGARCLRSAGTNASTFAKRHLLGEEVGLAFDPDTDRRGYYDRLLAYVVDDGRLFNHRLVAAGHARVYDSGFSRNDGFYDAQRDARQQRRGLWRCVEPTAAAGGTDLAIAEIRYDAPGDDNENLDGEYVVFANRGDDSFALDGWTVTDEAGHSYTFDGVTLDPNGTVTLYTGSGTDTGTERYWGRTGAVWNNDGDTVVVRNETGAVVRRSY